MTDKVVLSNRSALVAKYKASGEKAIRVAIQGLVAADRGRGLNTIYIAIDDAATMKKYKAQPVTKATNAAQNKSAVDAIYKKLAPDYIVLLGSVDVIPHQELVNPVFNPRRPGDDDDRVIPSDLPYACETPYGTAVEKFTGPTRVVGRIPDLTGATDPAYLVGVIKTAAAAKPRLRADYEKYFSLSASVWNRSTQLSLQAIFGSGTDEQVVPPKLPPWSAALLGRLSHFINCHGAPRSPQFYGQSGQRFPVSFDAATIGGKLSDGVIAAMECCYGAELYDPAKAKGQAGMGNTYLANKAYGYLGSTTTAYGPADANEWADVLCQYFLESVLGGASLGRALLEARQKYVQTGPTPLGPIDLKTLGQFILLGDPSIAPIGPSSTGPKPESFAKALPKHRTFAALGTDRTVRLERRKNLVANGLVLASAPTVKSRHEAPHSGALKKHLGTLARHFGIKDPSMMTFKTTPSRANTGAQPKALTAKQSDVTAVHVMMERRPSPQHNGDIRHSVAVVVREAAGQIVSVQQAFAK